MNETSLQQLVNQVQAHFNIFLPVSGGMGNSESEPIVLDIDNANLIAPLQHAVLHYLFLFRDHEWEWRGSEMTEKPNQVLEKVVAVYTDEPAYTYSYFFDITRPWRSNSKPMTISGNPYFPNSKVQIHSEN